MHFLLLLPASLSAMGGNVPGAGIPFSLSSLPRCCLTAATTVLEHHIRPLPPPSKTPFNAHAKLPKGEEEEEETPPQTLWAFLTVGGRLGGIE